MKKLALAVSSLVALSACDIPRDDSVIDKKTWNQYLAEGPAPERHVTEHSRPATLLAQNALRQAEVSHQGTKQILFGDTHVHTTFSHDAMSKLLPLANGMAGAFTPSDACDYARYISQIDFYFLTDHARSYTPNTWDKSIDTVRNCNRVAGDPNNPDLVAFMGYEWTHVGGTAEEHYGHHNVLYKNTDKLPARPVAALRYWQGSSTEIRPKASPWFLSLLNPEFRQYYQQHSEFMHNMANVPLCPADTNTLELPKNCLEYAQDPLQLYRKLHEFGEEAIVIQHGMAWGNSAPPNASWDHYFEKGLVNNKIVRLLEVYSGHGNSEEYRNFEERSFTQNGEVFCPEAQSNFLPGCRRAGELIYKWCKEDGEATSVCEERQALAQQYYVDEPTQLGWLTVPGSRPEDWLDAMQCRDCFLPAFSYRPKKSAQYGLALRDFNNGGGDDRFRWGFVASTDTHRAAAGHGFKQQQRLYTTDSDGMTKTLRWLQHQKRGERSSIPRKVTQELVLSLGSVNRDQERLTSFLSLGGLAAVHSKSRHRDAIWDALKARETYATSGHRTLLWFDYIGETHELNRAMGSQISLKTTPSFKVRALGSFKQLPGCPAQIKALLAPGVLQRLGFGECYNPSDERLKITRIEIVRIRPQISHDESVDELIEDVWKSFECDDKGQGCSVEFSDPEFSSSQRDAVYYVRAIEEPTPTINGANLRTRFYLDGKALAIQPCFGDERTPATDECLADIGHRAWSSPIYIDYKH